MVLPLSFVFIGLCLCVYFLDMKASSCIYYMQNKQTKKEINKMNLNNSYQYQA